MGQTPSEIETQIDHVRRETELIVKELARRVMPRNVLRLTAASVTEGATSAATRTVATAPVLFAAVGAMGLGVILFAISSAVVGARRHLIERDLE